MPFLWAAAKARDQLQRDFTLQPRVHRAVDFAHSTGADLLQQAVWTELRSFGDGHRALVRGKIVSLSASGLPLIIRYPEFHAATAETGLYEGHGFSFAAPRTHITCG
jgi:hypothetical protein